MNTKLLSRTWASYLWAHNRATQGKQTHTHTHLFTQMSAKYFDALVETHAHKVKTVGYTSIKYKQTLKWTREGAVESRGGGGSKSWTNKHFFFLFIFHWRPFKRTNICQWDGHQRFLSLLPLCNLLQEEIIMSVSPVFPTCTRMHARCVSISS